RWYEEGPLKGPLGRIEVRLTLVFVPLELRLLMDAPPARVLIQPGSAHPSSTIPQSPSERRPVHVPEVSVTQMNAENGRAFRSLTARGGGFVLDQGGAHRGAVAPHDLRCRVVLPPLLLCLLLRPALDRPDAPDSLLQFLLGMAIRLRDRLGRLAEIVEMAELIRDTVKG